MRRWLNPDEFPGVDALARAAIGDLPDLSDNRGRGPAPLVWMGLLSHLKWGKRFRSVWAGNESLARKLGLSVRAVEYGIAWLKRAGFVEAHWSPWRGCYGPGRVLRLSLAPGPAPRVVLPGPKLVAEIWRRCRKFRKRAVHMVTLAVAAFVHAAAEHGSIGRAKGCTSRVSTLAAFVGTKRGGTFSRRLADLESAGVLRRRRKTWAGGFVIIGRLCTNRLRELAREAESAIRSMGEPPRFVRVTDSAVRAAMSETYSRLRVVGEAC